MILGAILVVIGIGIGYSIPFWRSPSHVPTGRWVKEGKVRSLQDMVNRATHSNEIEFIDIDEKDLLNEPIKLP